MSDKPFLEDLYDRHHRLENLYPDPLIFARGYRDPLDGELAGLVAAALAYGHVSKIIQALEKVFGVLGPHPRNTLEQLRPAELAGEFSDFTYRFHKGRDLALFLHLVRQALGRAGSLRELFRSAGGEGDLAPALSAFSRSILAGDPRPVFPQRVVPSCHPVRHLLPSPEKGGAAKRLCLYLRWMVRSDQIDPGYWRGAMDPARLVVPLDTHVARVGRELGFTRRKSADWKTACEITESLRQFDPSDPVRYDFSLFRFGMEKGR